MSAGLPVNRRQFIQLSGLAAAGLAAGGTATDAATGRPNILLLQTDQHCHSVMGCAGNPVVQTPNLDRLAAEGVRFENAVCATPFCSPTRASWVTGQWPHTHGLMRNVQGNDPWLIDETTNLPNLLHDAGYVCGHFGKWHVGRTEDLRGYAHQGARKERNRAYNQFMRENTAIDPGKIEPPRIGWQHIEMTPTVAAFHEEWKEEKRRSPQDLSIVGRSDLAPELQWESWLADECIRFIEANRERSFFATYSVSPPHAFWVAPDPYYSMYKPEDVPWPESWEDRPKWYKQSQPARMGARLGEQGMREYLRCYYGQVTMMGAFMGRIIGRLEELGLKDNTLIIYTADHGDMQAAHGCMGKSLPAYYEEIVRVPLIVRVPGGSPGGKTISAHANSVDLMPTLLDYAGLAIPASVQGVSLRELIDGAAPDDDRPGFSERGRGLGGSRMIRAGTWKYAIVTGPKGGVRRELFDLQRDPCELRNLAGVPAMQETMKELEERLRAGLRKQGDEETVRELPWL